VLLTVFRFLRETSIDRAILSFGGAFVAVAAAPIGFFWITHWHNWYPLEVAIYLGLAILYLSTRLKTSLAVVVPVAAFHYVFWSSLYWCCVGREPVRQSVPFLGFCMALAWIHYVRTLKTAVS
jgi:hypothetical protein